MYCPNCGKKVSDQATSCPDCGHPLRHLRPGYEEGKEVSPKSRLVAILLAVFIGSLGIHRFYVGKVGTGIAMIFTLGGLGIWTLIDIIMIATGSFTDMEGKYVLDWQV
jgi:TM2 domain-containing membrane protein YozV